MIKLMQLNRLLVGVYIGYMLISCNSTENSFVIEDFKPVVNYQKDSLIKYIELDYTDAIDSGFVIPSIRQTDDGKFDFTFFITNNTEAPQSFYYKIYYQNESYKFPENHEFAHENFYGSWENTNEEFIKTPLINNDRKPYMVRGSFRIVGNPRNEEKYFGSSDRFNKDKKPSFEEISNVVERIRNNPEWLSSIIVKAEKNNITVDEQLIKDANFTIEENRISGNSNNRWKRNPRVGVYSAMLVVTTEKKIINNEIPDFIRNISRKDNNRFVNPYSFFRGNTKTNDVAVILVDKAIKVKAKPDPGKGIYVNPVTFKWIQTDTTYYSDNCNSRYDIYKKTAFEQFVHSLGDDVLLNNLPVTYDVTSANYSVRNYSENIQKYHNQRVIKPVKITNCPCQTVTSDSVSGIITIKNPASKPEEFKKEDVGIISRHGFTYGKFIAKVKLTGLLNEQHVWNGITNAVWLIYESPESWNNRRICYKEGGYQPGYYSGRNDKRVPEITYSEIDFEILKASHRWPATSYSDISKRPADNPAMKDKIMVTCTNWDMACWDPANFGVGVNEINYDNKTFYLHRWDHWYNAVTLKNPQPEKELFDSDFYYFEIEWKPEEIIWRIGPSKDKMKVVGYMNSTVTSIPNNQMLLIITQEFHITRWWPEAPFAQDNIPFPAKDIKGFIYDIEIE